ncbi:MAG: cytochrome c biogenesis CcdA family protein [Haloarculaceae archaeon]
MSPSVDLLGTAAFAFGAGVATFFSPCAYPLLPGYVGYYASQTSVEGADGDGAPLGGALVRGIAASVGVLAVFGAVLAVIATVGQTAVSHLEVLEPVIGLALVVLGALTLAGRAPDFEVALPRRRSSVAGFALFGVVYAVAAAGCVFPVFGAVVLQALTLPPAGTVAVVSVYALGIALLMIGVTLLTALGVSVGTGLVRYVDTVVRLAGAVMLLAGLGQLYLSVAVLHVV